MATELLCELEFAMTIFSMDQAVRNDCLDMLFLSDLEQGYIVRVSFWWVGDLLHVRVRIFREFCPDCYDQSKPYLPYYSLFFLRA